MQTGLTELGRGTVGCAVPCGGWTRERLTVGVSEVMT